MNIGKNLTIHKEDGIVIDQMNGPLTFANSQVDLQKIDEKSEKNDKEINDDSDNGQKLGKFTFELQNQLEELERDPFNEDLENECFNNWRKINDLSSQTFDSRKKGPEVFSKPQQIESPKLIDKKKRLRVTRNKTSMGIREEKGENFKIDVPKVITRSMDFQEENSANGN